MRFDVIIGNPPYQETIEGGGGYIRSSIPLYSEFTYLADKLNPRYTSFIIPSRWISGGQASMDRFRTYMVENRGLCAIYDFDRSTDVFPTVLISGGVCYFLIDNDNTYDECEMVNCTIGDRNKIYYDSLKRRLYQYKYKNSHGKDNYMIVRSNKAMRILNKIDREQHEFLDSRVLQSHPFGLETNFEGDVERVGEEQIKVTCSFNRTLYTSRDMIKVNTDKIDKYKIITGKLNPDAGGTKVTKEYNIINVPRILGPGEVCSGTYIVLNYFDTEAEAKNFLQYIKTKFARYLILITLTSMHLIGRNFMFVPLQDFNMRWTDDSLYEKYGLTIDEREYINSVIKDME